MRDLPSREPIRCWDAVGPVATPWCLAMAVTSVATGDPDRLHLDQGAAQRFETTYLDGQQGLACLAHGAGLIRLLLRMQGNEGCSQYPIEAGGGEAAEAHQEEEDLTQLQPGLVQRALLGRFRVEGLSERRSFPRYGGRWVP
jgi:hypothetical protein